jgi:hypothetical protein
LSPQASGACFPYGQKEINMKTGLQHYVGKMVQLRTKSFAALLARMGRRGMVLENRFLVGAANRRLGKLICYGSCLRLEIRPADIVLV